MSRCIQIKLLAVTGQIQGDVPDGWEALWSEFWGLWSQPSGSGRHLQCTSWLFLPIGFSAMADGSIPPLMRVFRGKNLLPVCYERILTWRWFWLLFSPSFWWFSWYSTSRGFVYLLLNHTASESVTQIAQCSVDIICYFVFMVAVVLWNFLWLYPIYIPCLVKKQQLQFGFPWMACKDLLLFAVTAVRCYGSLQPACKMCNYWANSLAILPFSLDLTAMSFSP